MVTSTSNGGQKGGTPLVPSWQGQHKYKPADRADTAGESKAHTKQQEKLRKEKGRTARP